MSDQNITPKKSIRPEIQNVVLSETMTGEERFQNVTLRPILKLQNKILLAIFRDYISEKEAKKTKNNEKQRGYFRLSATKQREFIDTVFQKDIKFKSQLLGMIIGHFDLEEYNLYAQNKTGTDRRIINLLKERIFTGLAELQQDS
ncbi:hypothetical protein [Bernardetia sp.]|uniref:hypothetical protein n=1 Tax=Bernardetia sp. TaxID=1937974 RepID=UPI0025C0A132|nr:hypothetical protein [Bernardetia sp.]